MDRPHNFNHLFFEGHLSYFHTVNKATVNSHAQVLCGHNFHFSGINGQITIAWRYGSRMFSCFFFLKNLPNCFPWQLYYFTFPLAMCEWSIFPVSLLAVFWEFLTAVFWEGFSRWHSSKESACQCRRHRRCLFDPWGANIPWSRQWQPVPVFLPGKSHGHRSLVATVHGLTES